MYRSVPSTSPVIVKPSVRRRSCQAEVGDPELALAVDHQIRRLDVTVDDADAVRVLQRFSSLDAEFSD
jgi:hypothetical protein